MNGAKKKHSIFFPLERERDMIHGFAEEVVPEPIFKGDDVFIVKFMVGKIIEKTGHIIMHLSFLDGDGLEENEVYSQLVHSSRWFPLRELKGSFLLKNPEKFFPKKKKRSRWSSGLCVNP